MRKLLIIFFLLFVTLLIIFISNNNIVCGAVFEYAPNMDNAIITSCPMDIGSVKDCFDGDLNTLARSAKINPAWVQIQFPEKIEVYKVKVSLGQPGYYDIVHNWWLESADSQSDLDNKTGSYRIAVPERFTTVDNVWDEIVLKQPVKSKIWRFHAKKTLGDDYVNIPELQLLCYYHGIKLDISSFLKTKSVDVKSDKSITTDLYKCFDDNPSSSSSVENHSKLLVDLKDSKLMINRIRFFVGTGQNSGETDSLKVEAADSIDDLRTKANSYRLIYDGKDNISYNNWKDIYVHVPLNIRYWSFTANRIDSSSPINISEIEFWVDQRFFDYPPAEPANLKVTERSKSSAALNWAPSMDSTGFVQYEIYRDGLLITSTKETNYIDKDLDPERAYTYCIQAYNISRKLSKQSISVVAEPFASQVITVSQNVTETDMPIFPAQITDIKTPAPSITLKPTPSQTAKIDLSINNNKDANLKAVPSDSMKQNDYMKQTKQNPKKGSSSNPISRFVMPISIILLIAFLCWLIYMIFKLKKKMVISQRKRETELNAIKQLLIEEKTEHVIELLGKKGKNNKS